MAEEALEWKNKGNKALKAKDFSEAVNCYSKAIELDGTNHTFFSNRSAAHLYKGDAASALKDGEMCIKLKADWGKGYVRKAQALHKMGDDRGAMETYQAGIKVAPNDKALMKAAMKLQKDLNTKMAQQLFPPNYMDRLKANETTRAYLEDANFVQMIEMCRQNPMILGQIIQQDQRMATVFQVLSGIPVSQAMGGAPEPAPAPARPRQTRNHWAPKPKKEEPKEEEAVEEEVVDPEVEAEKQRKEEIHQKALAFKDEGNKLYKEKDFDGAIAKYKQAAETEPTDMTYKLNIASALFGKHDYQACIDMCNEAISVGAEHGASFEKKAKAFGRIGNAYAKMKKWNEAIDAYEQGLLEADDKGIQKKLKTAKKRKKREEELAYLDPEKAAEAKEKGNELFRDGKFVESLEYYSDAIKRDPTNAVYFMNRAAAYTKLMDFDRGLQDCTKGLELDPTNVKGFFRKGNIEVMLKKYNKALDSFRAGLKIDPTDKACNIGLKRVMAKINSEMESGTSEERLREAMKDPEIQAIMNDPVMRSVLSELSDPMKAQKHMSNPDVAKKIEKLMAAGILSTGARQ